MVRFVFAVSLTAPWLCGPAAARAGTSLLEPISFGFCASADIATGQMPDPKQIYAGVGSRRCV